MDAIGAWLAQSWDDIVVWVWPFVTAAVLVLINRALRSQRQKDAELTDLLNDVAEGAEKRTHTMVSLEQRLNVLNARVDSLEGENAMLRRQVDQLRGELVAKERVLAERLESLRAVVRTYVEAILNVIHSSLVPPEVQEAIDAALPPMPDALLPAYQQRPPGHGTPTTPVGPIGPLGPLGRVRSERGGQE